MAAGSKLAELFVEVSADLTKYQAATRRAQAVTESTGRALTATFASVGARSAATFAESFTREMLSGGGMKAGVGKAAGAMTKMFGDMAVTAGTAAGPLFIEALNDALAYGRGAAGVMRTAGFAAASTFVSAFLTVTRPALRVIGIVTSPFIRAGREAGGAFSEAFAKALHKIKVRIIAIMGTMALGYVFLKAGQLMGWKWVEGFGNALTGMSRHLRGPLAKALLGASIVAIFAGAGVKAGFAFVKAFGSVAATITKTVTKIGYAVTKAFVSIGRRAAYGFATAIRGAMLMAMNPMALLGGTAILGGLAAAIGAPILAASNLNETINKTKETFKEATGVVMAGADDMAKRLGIPKREFLDSASSLGLIAKGAKMSNQESAKLGVTLAKAAADAASFYNVPLEEAMIAMRAGLVGESEPLRRFGILLNEDAVKAEALRLGLAKTTAHLTDAIKVQARYSLIVQGMATASGDLERTQGSLANRLREIRGRFLNLAADIGRFFLPAAEAAGEIIADIAQTISGKIEGKANIFQAWGESAKQVISYTGMIIRNLGEVKDILFKTSKENPWGQAWEQLKITFGDVTEVMIDKLSASFEYFVDLLKDAINETFSNVMRDFASALSESWVTHGAAKALETITDKRMREEEDKKLKNPPKMRDTKELKLTRHAGLKQDMDDLARRNTAHEAFVQHSKEIDEEDKQRARFVEATQEARAKAYMRENINRVRETAMMPAKELAREHAAIRPIGAATPEAAARQKATQDAINRAREEQDRRAADRAKVTQGMLARIKDKDEDRRARAAWDQAELIGRQRKKMAGELSTVKQPSLRIRPMTAQQDSEERYRKTATDLQKKITVGEAKDATKEQKETGKAAGEKLEELAESRKTEQEKRRNMRMFGNVNGPDTNAGRTVGLEDFQRQIQESIFSGGKDPAKDTASNTKSMVEILQELRTSGLKIKGDVVAIATD